VLNSLLRGLIRLYQLAVSPVLAPSCRYLPSCSDYALEALARPGAAPPRALPSLGRQRLRSGSALGASRRGGASLASA
jgi:hypothetical protein